MPRSDQDNQQIRAARRQEILAAALEVFAAKGVAHTKVADIAKAAGLSHGLLYHYFPSKEAVFEAIVEEMMLEADADLAPSTERAITRLTRSISRRIERLSSGDPVRVVTQALLQGEAISSELQARLGEHLVRVRKRARDLIARAQAEGDLDGRIAPDQLALALMFLFRGMALDVASFPLPLPHPQTILAVLGATATKRPTRRNAHATRRTGT